MLAGEAYWCKVADMDFLVEEGVIDIEDRNLFWYAETADDIWGGLLCWYERNSESLIEEEQFSGGCAYRLNRQGGEFVVGIHGQLVAICIEHLEKVTFLVK